MGIEKAKKQIDEFFGDGTADEKPELVIQLMQVDALKEINGKLEGIFQKMNASKAFND